MRKINNDIYGMKHAYLIMVHNEPKILDLQLKLLKDVHNDIYIHIDAKSNALFYYVKEQYSKRDDIHILNQRFCVNWGGQSQVKLELFMLEYAKNHGKYSYFHLLSGVDLPIKPIKIIYSFFENSNKNFIGFHQGKDFSERVDFHHLFIEHLKDSNILIRNISTLIRNFVLRIEKSIGYKRKYPYELMKGANWFSITDELANYVLKNKNTINKIFRYIPCCDEIFLQTIVWNSPFKFTLYDINDEFKGCMRKIDWNRGNPYVWQNQDANEIIESEMMFARKFCAKDSDVILQEIFNHVVSCN